MTLAVHREGAVADSAVEEARLNALYGLQILDTDAEPQFDALVDLAAWAFGTEIALISLVDRDRQWFKAKVGLEACSTDRNVSFCTHAIRGDDVLVVPNALDDPRFADNPLVVGPPYIRFYAGAPLTLGSGERVGTLCLIDSGKRPAFSESDRNRLKTLAGLAVEQLEARRAGLAQPKAHERSRRIEEVASAVESGFDGIGITDPEGRFVYLNATHCAMFGYTEAELVGRSWETLYDAAERERIARVGFAALRDVGKWRSETIARRKDGSPLHQEISLTRLSDGRILCSTRDITERLEAERQRLELEAQLFQAQKLDALGRLAGGIAHDFNNVLASIRGYTDFLREDLAGRPEAAFVEKIAKASDRAQDLVGRILSFARRADPKLETVAVHEVLQETQALVAPLLGRKVRIDLDAGDPRWLVDADRTQLQQVLINLVVNARDALPGGEGEIGIGVERRTVDGGCAHGLEAELAGRAADVPIRIHHASERSKLWLGVLPEAGDYICITVSDRGVGMAPETVERIFEPFFTTKDVGVGTGLGMSSVMTVVLSMKGALTIETAPDRGTVCRLFFRRTVGDTAEQPPQAQRGEDTAAGLAIVLIVDDDADVGAMLEAGFGRLGLRATRVVRAEQALEVVRGGQRIDAVLTDQRMPGMHGDQLVQALRAGGFEGPIGIMSGYSDELDEHRATAVGADFLIDKPVAPSVLRERLLEAAALRDSRSPDDALSARIA